MRCSGHAKDETFTADLTLSDSYSTSETSLNGLAVTYTITVSKVEQTVVPETLTDEMVKNYTEMMASLLWAAAIRTKRSTNIKKQYARAVCSVKFGLR